MSTTIETAYPHPPVPWQWDMLPDTAARDGVFAKLPKPSEPVPIAAYGPDWRYHCPYCRKEHHHGASDGDVTHRISHCWSRFSPWKGAMLELHRVGDALPAKPTYPWSKRKGVAS
jgi:hypothetical protein